MYSASFTARAGDPTTRGAAFAMQETHRSAAGPRADDASHACTRAHDPRAIERSARPQLFKHAAPAASVNPSAPLRGAPLRSAPAGDGRVTGGRCA